MQHFCCSVDCVVCLFDITSGLYTVLLLFLSNFLVLLVPVLVLAFLLLLDVFLCSASFSLPFVSHSTQKIRLRYL